MIELILTIKRQHGSTVEVRRGFQYEEVREILEVTDLSSVGIHEHRLFQGILSELFEKQKLMATTP